MVSAPAQLTPPERRLFSLSQTGRASYTANALERAGFGLVTPLPPLAGEEEEEEEEDG